jgi:excisionase family DNA binding protein
MAERMTIAQAAEALGISRDTIRRKIKRGELDAVRGNDGAWRVEITVPDSPALPKAAHGAAAYASQPALNAELVQELRDQIAALQQELDRTRAEQRDQFATLRADHQGELERLHVLLGNLTTPHPSFLDRLLSRLRPRK